MFEQLLAEHDSKQWYEIECKAKGFKSWERIAEYANRRSVLTGMQRLKEDNPDNDYRPILVNVTRETLILQEGEPGYES